MEQRVWEVNLGGEWEPLGEVEAQLLRQLEEEGKRRGRLQSRGHTYTLDIMALTLTNVATGKVRQIRHEHRCGEAASRTSGPPNGHPGVTHPRAASRRSSGDGGASGSFGERCVEAWQAGAWETLGGEVSGEISRQQAVREKVFELTSLGFSYRVDLGQMTMTNLTTGHTRSIRFSVPLVTCHDVGFEKFRESFHVHAATGYLEEINLLASWPSLKSHHGTLLEATVQRLVRDMDLRHDNQVDMMEWNHYWALQRDGASFHAGNELNAKLREALLRDPLVLERLQMHFETAVGDGEDPSSGNALPVDGLLRACRRLVASPDNKIEKHWAQQVLRKHADDQSFDKSTELNYYDFLSMMLGRRRFKVYLWIYDVSAGFAKRWSWLVLGQHISGLWHTAVVVEWPDRDSEFWFGGNIFESKPGQTPFGEPVERRFLGYTWKLRVEVWDYIQRYLASSFTGGKYELLTHNSNHLSEKLSVFLHGQHIPYQVLHQLDIVNSKAIPQLLRPHLNAWLGSLASKDGRASDGGKARRLMWEAVLPTALVEFHGEKGGRPLLGEVRWTYDEDCIVCCLDFWSRGIVERRVGSEQIMRILQEASAGASPTLRNCPSEVPYGRCASLLCRF